ARASSCMSRRWKPRCAPCWRLHWTEWGRRPPEYRLFLDFAAALSLVCEPDFDRSRRPDRAPHLRRLRSSKQVQPCVACDPRPRFRGVLPMATGVVKWFNMAKGFGFIAPDEGGQDVFVHVSAVERSGLTGLREGQAVSFDVETDPRKNKPAAVNIKAV